MQPIILFLDIDGVFTMLDAVQLPMERVGGIHVRPIPMANTLLKAINDDERLDPVWLTSWDRGAHLWNERAETTRWPVAYHLSKRDERDAKTVMSWLFDMDIDRKLIAAQYFLFRARPLDCPVVWIEDGFAQETRAWAKERGNVRLVDTLAEPVRSRLLAPYADPEQAAHEFIETHFLRAASEVGRSNDR